MWILGLKGYKNKYSRKGKLNEKKFMHPINPKKYSCYGLKNIHTRNLMTKKNSWARKFPTPPITFLIVRPLVEVQTNAGYIHATHA